MREVTIPWSMAAEMRICADTMKQPEMSREISRIMGHVADCSGWCNQETWVLWSLISNDERAQKLARLIAHNAARAGGSRPALRLCSEKLRDWIEKYIESARCYSSNAHWDCIAVGLITSALGRVNWDELAEAFLEQVNEPVAE